MNSLLISLLDLPSPSNQVIINNLADFVNDGSKIILQSGKRYILNNTIISPYYFEIPVGASLNFTSVDLSKALVYTGTGAMFRGSNFGIVVTNLIIFQAPNGTFFDLDNAGTWYNISTIFTNASGCGTVKIGTFTSFFCQFSNIGIGFTFADRTDLVKRIQVSFSHVAGNAWKNQSTTLASFYGNIGIIVIQDSGFEIKSNEKAFYFDNSLRDNGVLIQISTLTMTSVNESDMLAPNSLDHSYLKSNFEGILKGTNSTTSGFKDITNNALVSVITAINTPVLINALDECRLMERLFARDRFIANETTDTFTSTFLDGVTTFNHDMSNGDLIFIKNGVGATLPSGLTDDQSYYVVNSAATTFQLSYSLGGSPVSITTNGSGSFYFDHEKTNNVASWVVYRGQETVTVALMANYAIQKETQPSDVVVYTILKKSDVSLTESIVNEGSSTTIDNIRPSTSVLNSLIRLSIGEGLRIYVTNKTDTADLIVTDGHLSILRSN